MKKIIIIITLILILTIFASYLSKKINDYSKEQQNKLLSVQELKDKEDEETIIKKLSNMSEINRLKTYFGEFLKYIEEERYDKSYNMLNTDFKRNYFRTKEDFEKYVKEKYPKNAVVTYNEIKRYGEIFILNVTISKVLSENFTPFEQRIVIRENGANEFTLSFQVE